jgi:hypothetical protein
MSNILTPEGLRDLHDPACPQSDLPYDWIDHSSLPTCTCTFKTERYAFASAWEADRRRLAEGVAIVLKLRARIEELEVLEKTVNKAGLNWRRWGKLLVAAEAHIEALERNHIERKHIDAIATKKEKAA